MNTQYDPHQIETRCYQLWEANGYFKPSGKGKPYCIMIPPPNVTGSLHMGHAFQQTLMDVLIRYHRMTGDNTLWQAGSDHAGIATQMVVENQLALEGKTRHDLGREAFIKKAWEWKHQSGNRIREQLKRIGGSLDWSRERFTMDASFSKAVSSVFETLFDEGLIYRGKRLVNWDPVLNTAVSDLEVEFKEKKGQLWHLRYPIVGSEDYLIVATTRPETMLGDTAVAVHPEDSRYQHLIGKQIRLPLTERVIPIISDEYVDQTFGSGCVKITPAHDFNDYEIGKRHQLPMITILTPQAKIDLPSHPKYHGLSSHEARKAIIHDLAALDLIEKIEDHTLQVPYGERSGAVIEPYLTDQWFVKTKPLAAPALAAVKNGDLTFIPKQWENTYFQWLENIQDWCISRQLWWGHRIPAWYDSQNNTYVGESEEKVRKKYQLSDDVKLTQDPDVLDTWFSSSLWPFATLGWPEKTPDFQTFYPTDTLITGFDIIFFWVARMVMMGLKFTDQIPFHTVYIHGLIRDEEGQKMSKSKGNVLDPIDLIDGIRLEDLLEKRTQHMLQPDKANRIKQRTRKAFPHGIQAYGTDALRFTYCALASFSRDIQFSMKRIEGYRNFCNKIWNAARFILMNVEKQPEHYLKAEDITLSLADRWVTDQLQSTIEKSVEAIKHYRFDHLAQTLYDFVWNEFCDWYLELSKIILNDSNSTPQAIAGTCQTLLFVLDTILRLLHPITPFITEVIWQQIAGLLKTTPQKPSIMLQPYPEVDNTKRDNPARTEIDWIKQIVISIRNIRGEMNISPNQPLSLFLYKGSSQDQAWAKAHETLFKSMLKLETIQFIQQKDSLGFTATAILGKLELHIPLEGIIDKDAEIKRLEKAVQKLAKEQTVLSGRLSNENYIKRAPADIVEKEKNKFAEAEKTLEKLKEQLDKIRVF